VGKVKIINGDCIEEMKKLESGSVDLILTDPPYGTVKNICDSENFQHGMAGKTGIGMKQLTQKIFLKNLI